MARMRDEGAVSPDTVRARADVWRRLERTSGKPMRDITRADVERFCNRYGREWAPATRQAYLAHIRAYFRATGLPDPTDGIARPRVRRGVPRGLSPEDRDRVLAAYPDGDLAVILRLMMRLGMRRGEVAQLRRADIFLGPDGRQLILVHGKGARDRVVPVPDWLVPYLAGYTFPDRPREWYSRIVADALAMVGVSATAHQLRHTAATDAYRATHDLLAVQRLLGHESPAVTAVYAAPDRDAVRDALERIGG